MFSFSALRTASFLVTPFMVLIYLAVNGCLQEQTAVLWKEPKHNLALESKGEGDLLKTDVLPGELKRAKCVITQSNHKAATTRSRCQYLDTVP